MATLSLPTQGGDSGTWGTELNAFIKGSGMCYLGEASVGLQNGDSAVTIYTVPTGQEAMPMAVLVHSPSGSLAGATDIDFGDETNSKWLRNVDLSGMTATSDYRWLFTTGIFTIMDAADIFKVTIRTGATADVTATVILLGMEIAA